MSLDPAASAQAEIEDDGGPVPHVLRGMTAGDVGFVLDSWRRSYDDAQHARAPSLAVYLRTQRAVIEQCLRTSEVTIAHWPDVADQILGWVCHRGDLGYPVVHYAFVKKDFRKRGLGRSLFEHAAGKAGPVWTTHSRRLEYWKRSHRIVFNPALIW